LAFKPNTDDMREAPSRVLLELLWQHGASVCAYDPAAITEARKIYGDREAFKLAESPLQALDEADGLIVVTEWKEFRSPPFEAMKARLKCAVIFDGRNIYDPQTVKSCGFVYYGIGRGQIA
jgi:UDPglucose 6-dehydrogenase